jgi:hypothetical protein
MPVSCRVGDGYRSAIIRIATTLLAAAVLLAAPMGAAASEPSSDPSSEPEWELSFTPYLWGIAMKGDARVRDVEIDVDVPFSDIAEKLNFGFMGVLEARRNRWFVASDFLGALLEDDISAGPVVLNRPGATVSRSQALGPGGRGSASGKVTVPGGQVVVGPAEVDVDSRLIVVQAVGGYRFFSQPMASILGKAAAEDRRRLTLDAYAGARVWWVKVDVDLFVPPTSVGGFTVNPSLKLTSPRGRTRRVDFGDVSVPGLTTSGIDEDVVARSVWVDPLIGLRAVADVTETISVRLAGDVGGFGIGSASDFSWNAAAFGAWRFAENWSLLVGYRALGVDRDAGEIALDMVMHGPLMGLRWQFWP